MIIKVQNENCHRGPSHHRYLTLLYKAFYFTSSIEGLYKLKVSKMTIFLILFSDFLGLQNY